MSTILDPPYRPYPNATKSREVIPHDIASPAGCFMLVVPPGGASLINQIPQVAVISISCASPVMAVFSASETAPELVEGELLGGALYCAPGTTVSLVPEVRRLWLLNQTDREVVVYVQLLHQWQFLGTTSQVSTL